MDGGHTPDALEKVSRAIEQIKQGKMVIMVDEEDRENEGDLVFAAEFASQELVNFMAKEARGLICLTLAESFVDRLKLPMMGDLGRAPGVQSTAFTVSIEARQGVTTGISAADRAHTIRVAIDEQSGPQDIVVPGHIFPLRAKPGGVLERAGHTEGSVDIARMAGLKGAAVICEIMNDDGSMARLPDLQEFSKKHDIPIIAIDDLIKVRLQQEAMIEKIRETMVETQFGSFRGVLFRNKLTGQDHLALVKGQPFHDSLVEVRVHHQRPLADVFASPEYPAGQRLCYGLRMLKEAEHGVLLYLCADDPNALLAEDLAWLEQKQPASLSVPRVKMDDKMLGMGAQILRSLGVRRMRIHTTSKRKFTAISAYGLEIVEAQTMAMGGE